MSRWVYVVLTAILAVAVAVWAIPYLGDATRRHRRLGRGQRTCSASRSPCTSTRSRPRSLLLAVGVGLLVQIYSTAYLGTTRATARTP